MQPRPRVAPSLGLREISLLALTHSKSTPVMMSPAQTTASSLRTRVPARSTPVRLAVLLPLQMLRRRLLPPHQRLRLPLPLLSLQLALANAPCPLRARLLLRLLLSLLLPSRVSKYLTITCDDCLTKCLFRFYFYYISYCCGHHFSQRCRFHPTLSRFSDRHSRCCHCSSRLNETAKLMGSALA